MNFEWSQEQNELYQQAIEFAKKKMNKNLIEEDRNEVFSREKWQACADLGLMGMIIPEKYGGLGLDALTVARVMDGFGYGCQDTSIFLSIGAHIWAVQMPILLFGSEEIKQKYLPRLVSGEWVGAHAISEPSAGSDAMAMNTTAVKDGDFYILNGSKTFVTNAPVADLFVAFATINKKYGFAGVTCFAFERNTPGISVESKMEKMGSRTSPMSDVVFRDARIPLSNVIGAPSGGSRIFSRIMFWERALILAPFLGAMQRQIEECVQYANDRVQFGKRLSAYQSISGKIVDMQVRLESARILLYKAAWDLEHGDATMPASIAKLVTSDAAVQTFLDAIQVFGGYGYTTDFEIERHLRDAIGTRIYSGTSEMQKMIIANTIGLKTQG
ncbi:MAG: acyl-CoA dehydrogenase family protein [Chloroflexota bacterium]|jgi:alkylation response protein AidB-like acyl-CoA dehydrogenase